MHHTRALTRVRRSATALVCGLVILAACGGTVPPAWLGTRVLPLPANVLPELASAYLDRSRVRPGMVTPDGPVVRASVSIRWSRVEWGGAWRALKDHEHVSEGR